jgi:hypothetical protein
MKHDWIEGDGVTKTITNERLAELAERVVPLVLNNEEYFTIEQPDLRKTAYTWSPQLTARVGFIPLKKVMVDFPCGYYGFFKPSIAEVLAWYPDDVKGINCFCLEKDELDIYQSGSHQRAEVTFGKID